MTATETGDLVSSCRSAHRGQTQFRVKSKCQRVSLAQRAIAFFNVFHTVTQPKVPAKICVGLCKLRV